jgi:hypothetical protein
MILQAAINRLIHSLLFKVPRLVRRFVSLVPIRPSLIMTAIPAKSKGETGYWGSMRKGLHIHGSAGDSAAIPGHLLKMRD